MIMVDLLLNLLMFISFIQSMMPEKHFLILSMLNENSYAAKIILYQCKICYCQYLNHPY